MVLELVPLPGVETRVQAEGKQKEVVPCKLTSGACDLCADYE